MLLCHTDWKRLWLFCSCHSYLLTWSQLPQTKSVEGRQLDFFRFEITSLYQTTTKIKRQKYYISPEPGWIITSSGVKWTEFSLIIGMGYLVLVLTWSSIPQSVCKRAFSLLTSGCLRRPAWNPGLTNGRQLISFQFEIISLSQSTT